MKKNDIISIWIKTKIFEKMLLKYDIFSSLIGNDKSVFIYQSMRINNKKII